MSGNTTPQWPLAANAGIGVEITAANTKSDGAGTIATDLFLCMTAGANGSFVDFVRFMPTATVAGTTTTGTIGRVFLCNTNTGAVTAASCTCLGEVLLTSIVADSSTVPVNVVDFPVGFRIPASWTILVSNHAAPAANTKWKAIAVAGDY